MQTGTEREDFEVLFALSLARTALDDPVAIGLREIRAGVEESRNFAIKRIDEVIGALYFEPANDYRSEARWTLTHIGRLLAAVAETLGSTDEEDLSYIARELETAGDHIDEAIEHL
jgi:phosphate uptake regulator